MTKRLIFQLIFCGIFSIANVSMDLLPLGKIYLKTYMCQLKIDDLLKHKSYSKVLPTLSENELKELQKMKNNYCKSTIQFIN